MNPANRSLITVDEVVSEEADDDACQMQGSDVYGTADWEHYGTAAIKTVRLPHSSRCQKPFTLDIPGMDGQRLYHRP